MRVPHARRRAARAAAWPPRAGSCRVRRRGQPGPQQPVRPAERRRAAPEPRRRRAPGACRRAGRATRSSVRDGQPQQREQQPGQRQVGEQHEQRVLPVEPVQPAAGARAPGAAGGCAASAWCTTASVTTTTRWPARLARQPRSTSSRSSGSRRVEAAELVPDVAADQHPGGADGQHRRGCRRAGPGRCSRRSSPVSRRPLRAIVTPTSSSSRAVAQAEHLGAGDRRPTGRGSTSAEQLLEGVRAGRAVVVQQPDPVGRRVPASRAARDRGAEPGARGAGRRPRRCRARPASGQRPVGCPRSPAPLVSTATTVSGGRVWPASAVRRPGSQRSPSWATTTAVTVTAPVGSALSARRGGWWSACGHQPYGSGRRDAIP